jgi:RNA-directed DNA polymerase
LVLLAGKRFFKKAKMKRIGNLYDKICSLDNLRLADERARRGKRRSYGVKFHDRNRESNILKLHHQLKNKTFKTSPYEIFKIYEPKERDIYRLPYFPDRIMHHAVMNIMEPIWMSIFTADTYSCIKGRGIHTCAAKLKKALQEDHQHTRYCLKLDIRRFYPTIDHQILKDILSRKIKDKDVMWLLGEVIDSAAGVPIGNYLSQYFANIYLAYFDHWIKEDRKVKYYYRYADDIVVLAETKKELHQLFQEIRSYLEHNLKLEIKDNYQIFPVEKRGIDFVGYRFWHTHTLLRKRIKKNFAKAIAKNKGPESLVSYMGWAKHCNSKHLIKKLIA